MDAIYTMAAKWHSAAAEVIVEATRNWNREIDCPMVELTSDVDEMGHALVHWCDQSGKPIDPTPITDFIRFAREAGGSARTGNAAGAKPWVNRTLHSNTD